MAFDVPILFIVFSRPRTTGPVMEAIRAARPTRLYVAADGPRNEGERVLCEQARHIATAVDWPCELITLLRNENLGCRRGPSSAISWFFEHESRGIILEDDCLPSASFFPYCAELLEKYANDQRVMSITGDNFQPDMSSYPYSYYFSKWFHTWGWATWARAWRLYDEDLELYPDWLRFDCFKNISPVRGFSDYWKPRFDKLDFSKDTWDYIWLFTSWAYSGMTITPRVNLVSNIGFGPDGTHCPDVLSPLSNRPRFAIEIPLKHPKLVMTNKACDDYITQHFFKIKPISSKAHRVSFI